MELQSASLLSPVPRLLPVVPWTVWRMESYPTKLVRGPSNECEVLYYSVELRVFHFYSVVRGTFVQRYIGCVIILEKFSMCSM